MATREGNPRGLERVMASERRRTYQVTAKWDPEARVWVATSNHVKGLVVSGATQDALVEKLLAVAPALLKANEGKFVEGGALEINYIKQETIPFSPKQAA